MTTETIASETQMAAAVQFFPWWILLIQGIAALLLGIAFLVQPYFTLLLAVTFVGAYWFISGILGLISLAVDKSQMGWKILIGILGIIAGIVILVQPIYSAIILVPMLVIFIGVWGLLIGGTKLVQAFSTKDWSLAIIGLLAIILGIILLIYPFITAALLPFVFGGFGLVFGIVTIITSFMMRKTGAPGPGGQEKGVL